MAWHVQSNPAEVTPIKDIRSHASGAACWCQPKTVGGVLVHNALDGREVLEQWGECNCANEDGDKIRYGHHKDCPLYHSTDEQ